MSRLWVIESAPKHYLSIWMVKISRTKGSRNMEGEKIEVFAMPENPTKALDLTRIRDKQESSWGGCNAVKTH